MLGYVEGAYRNIHRLQDYWDRCSVQRHQSGLEAVTICEGAVGRPAFCIPREVIQHLLDLHLSVPMVSGVSVSTVRRRMTCYSLSVRDTYSTIHDEELDAHIQSVHIRHPSWGVRQTYGYFISIGIRMQYQRVRESLCRIDPEGSYMRRLRHLRSPLLVHKVCGTLMGVIN